MLRRGNLHCEETVYLFTLASFDSNKNMSETWTILERVLTKQFLQEMQPRR